MHIDCAQIVVCLNQTLCVWFVPAVQYHMYFERISKHCILCNFAIAIFPNGKIELFAIAIAAAAAATVTAAAAFDDFQLGAHPCIALITMPSTMSTPTTTSTNIQTTAATKMATEKLRRN